MLVVQDIEKRYGATVALAGVSVQISPAEIVALAGENGSGKSTLAKILAGVIRQDSGVLLVDGEQKSFAGPREALADGIALVAQEPTAVPEMSIAENLSLAALNRPFSWVNRANLDRTARELLHLVGVHADPGAAFAALKSGDRELVEVAKALALHPRFLILDEATSRLGERDVERLFRIIHRLKDEGTSTILITHRLREITDHADRAVVLRDGRLAGELSRAELTDERLSSMMVGRELGHFFHKRNVKPGGTILRVEELVVDGAPAPVSLQVHASEVVGLAGLVGSGRTELLETIAGVRRARGGRVIVNGLPIPGGSARSAISAGVALVPEDRHRQGLVLSASIRENTAMSSWRALGWVRKSRERAEAQEAIRELAIRASDVEVAAGALSGGNQQKVVVGRLLSLRPSVLLLDEPTRGVDVGAREDLYRIIGDLVNAGTAVLLASSDLLEVLGVCDRIIVMHERRIAGDVSRDSASEERIAFLSGGGVGGCESQLKAHELLPV